MLSSSEKKGRVGNNLHGIKNTFPVSFIVTASIQCVGGLIEDSERLIFGRKGRKVTENWDNDEIYFSDLNSQVNK